jgi:DinB superfamily
MTAAFDPRALRHRLESFPTVLNACAGAVSATDARWKPAPEHWSILEVCCHMLDEEREDFVVRIASTLRDPAVPWPRLELEGVAERRRYSERDLADTLRAFEERRAANIAWLDSELDAADFSRAYQHPKFGALHAGMLLASWAAHDALHLRQVAKRLHGLAARDAGPYGVRYAGEW